MNAYSLVGEQPQNQKNKRKKQNRLFRSEAQATLMAKDNYYKSILAHLICVLMSGGFFYAAYLVNSYGKEYGIGDMSAQAVSAFTLCLSVILCVIGAFLMFSFFLGAYTLCCEMNGQTEADGSTRVSSLSAILTPFSSKRELKNTFVLFIILAFELFICTAPTVFIFRFVGQTGQNGFSVFMIKVFILACSVFVGLFFTFFLLPYPYISKNSNEKSVFRMYAQSVKASLCDIWLGYNMILSFVFLLILSALSFGVLYFAYTMPYMTHSMAKVGEYLYKLSVTERNEINET